MNLFEKIFEHVALIPKGKVATYGQIANLVGSKDARKVGWALHGNKDPIKYPCHRVVNKQGKLSPSYVFGGLDEQKIKLLNEGVIFKNEDTVDLEKCLWEPQK